MLKIVLYWVVCWVEGIWDSKGKKRKKKKKWTKVPVQLKKNRIEKFETQNLRRGNAALVLVEDIEVTNKEKCKT